MLEMNEEEDGGERGPGERDHSGCYKQEHTAQVEVQSGDTLGRK